LLACTLCGVCNGFVKCYPSLERGVQGEGLDREREDFQNNENKTLNSHPPPTPSQRGTTFYKCNSKTKL